MRVAIIGAGMLGEAVGMRMIGSGIRLAAYNRTRSKTDGLKSRGAEIFRTPADAARGCDVAITCVTDFDALKDVCFGTGGLAELSGECPTVCDMSTISPDESRELTERLALSSITMLGTPVMGGPDAAAAGKLVMMVSGSQDVLSECRKVLSAAASQIFHIGEAGDAHAVKLAMNLQIAMLALSLSEGIILSEKSGVDPKKFLEVLNSTYFGTGMSRKKAYGMAGDGVNPTFLLRNLKKDLAALAESSSNMGLDLRMGSKALSVYEEAVKAGHGELDYTGIIEYLRKD